MFTVKIHSSSMRLRQARLKNPFLDPYSSRSLSMIPQKIQILVFLLTWRSSRHRGWRRSSKKYFKDTSRGSKSTAIDGIHHFSHRKEEEAHDNYVLDEEEI